MKYETIVVGALKTNCYLVYCKETLECAVIDPGAEAEKIFSVISRKNLRPIVIINTHSHFDHVGANKHIKDKYNIPLYIHSLDSKMSGLFQQLALSFLPGAKASPPPDKLLEDGENIEIGKSSLKVIHTPGHSPGSISLMGNSFLLSGDALFCGGIGRTDIPGGSLNDLQDSIKNKILVLPDETIVLPGHGPSTTIAQEKDSNPFIR